MEIASQILTAEKRRMGERAFFFLLPPLFALFFLAASFAVFPARLPDAPLASFPEAYRREFPRFPAALEGGSRFPFRVLRNGRFGNAPVFRISARGIGGALSGIGIAEDICRYGLFLTAASGTAPSGEGSFYLEFSVSALPVRAGPGVC